MQFARLIRSRSLLTGTCAMTYPRESLICLQATPYYHVVSRCVRRSWLWGVDEYAGKDYSHRKDWVLERLRELSSVFAIDICAYAVLSNHYHLVLHVDAARVRAWSKEEIVGRWCRLFHRPVLIEQWQQRGCPEAVRAAAEEIIADWRQRLFDVSWYMRCLNEHLARRANAEDECTGRFWEGRFKSQALLDEAGLLTAMAYVDLNPIRAGIATSPEESEFTSIYARIQALRASASDFAERAHRPPLLDFHTPGASAAPVIPFALKDYLTLVDWSGRAVRSDKRGAIDPQLPPLLRRLNIDAEAWQATMQPHGNVFGRALGQLDHLRLHARALGQSWIRGLWAAERLYRGA
jgi:REP element-mobilizing transposase RayT